MKITHAGYDTAEKAWGLWAVDDSGQDWFIPTDEATCIRLVTETEVQDYPTDQGEVQS